MNNPDTQNEKIDKNQENRLFYKKRLKFHKFVNLFSFSCCIDNVLMVLYMLKM